MSDHLIWRLRNNDTAKHLCGLAADEIERLRDALNMARVDLDCLSDYGGISHGAKVGAVSAHLDVCRALGISPTSPPPEAPPNGKTSELVAHIKAPPKVRTP